VEHLCYRCDVTRCFVYGKPSRYYEQVYGVVREAKQAAIRMVAPGVRVKDVDEAARQVIRGAGLPVYGHGTGHGVGLEVHEQPGVGPGGDGVLEAGMVVTIEPGVYIPGKVGIRLEDDVLVTAKGSRILTPMFPDTFEAACQLPNSQ
jgi:Xaa-Pro aminopeptidase